MAKKCVHKGCGKVYDDDDEPCIYHPDPPIFHEGQKGWKCCKPRVLTFDEFLSIPPCTTGKHADVEDRPAPAPKPSDEAVEAAIRAAAPKQAALPAPAPRLPQNQSQLGRAPVSPAPPEDESDDPSLPIPAGQKCRRRGCGAAYSPDESRENETCVHHPGAPIFHEGSKGYSCCKRRVLEFDQFLKIEGCKTKDRHLFVGSGKKPSEETLQTVRHDYYQTASTVIASIYLKKIDKETSTVKFSSPTSVDLDLHTSDNKRYNQTVPLYAQIDPENSLFRIMGTKLELTLAKADGTSWPVLRADERRTGEILQVGRAGRV